jgi:hypothetical protein
MRNFKLIFLASLASAIVILTFGSCVTTTHFATSAITPAAEGTVKIKKDANKNYVIKIQITNLAESSKLTPPMNAYVVWLVTDDNMTKNAGQIKSSSAFLSKSLNATFETVSPLKPIKVFITAENDASIQYPLASDFILTTDYMK